MAPSALVFKYEDKRVICSTDGKGTWWKPKTLELIEQEALDKLNLHIGSYDFYDQFGRIEVGEDLQRAMSMAGTGECEIEVREHKHYIRIRQQNERHDALVKKVENLEAMMQAMDDTTDTKIRVCRTELTSLISKVEHKMLDEVIPGIEGLVADKNAMQKDIRGVVEKLNAFNLEELTDLGKAAKEMRDEVRAATRRVNELDTTFANYMAELRDNDSKNSQDIKDLQKYIMGKLDIAIEADADIRRDQQLLNERMHMVADDLRLVTEDHQRLASQCGGALEDNEELRMLLGQVREDNEHVRAENWQVSTRVHCLEGTATERWEGFAPGVLYFRGFSRTAKGPDIQFNSDLTVATGRGFLSATGVVIGTDEGLVVGDGPTRHYGTPGCFSSYFEIEIEEISMAPSGAGGLFVGMSLQSAQEIANHPKKEFDGWLIGGNSKALICRASSYAEDDTEDRIPDTFGVDASETARKTAMKAVYMLRQAMPPKTKGEVREVESVWRAQDLRMKDRVGVLFRCGREGGARLRITINGDIIATHNFIEAPPAEAVGFLTPVIRLAGNGKAVRLKPGVQPPSRILADD
eukprot:TRINITY_DN4549_c0_g1_i1.p1 TRINITY_DN4549_c0_g1~~TRINITY_DN4549_c0_g1_i1.p1  ORF type:complete len:579 (-),score=139.96 TRINITY_DN4549_c0_g1_i1:115-1851(-)